MQDAKKARIQLQSRHEGEDVVQKTEAEVFERGGALYLKYEEPETDLQGQKIRTLLKITSDSLKMIRHGAVESEQSFQEGQRLPGFYRSPYTSFNLSTQTSLLEIRLNGTAGTIRWAYDLYVHEECTGHFNISLHIQEDTQ
ncbi:MULTISPECIES: DUF1934 domain-containing protein [Paenibacillus]|uniref:DUF1934 domain-containing protein n=1 Tax=Paenibacillus azoreducens TaxID=116718 RepID=A0A920CU82_9BACL|nr:MULTISPECIES: DUF1934 domain-containing protein [Paenibacillus]MBE9917691.1 DUF1934 domain-containing protein [Paenibacillus donghaensis]GIO51070.1 hypothetical protein J34TS1_58350 [Paenibacillus azoreducens]